VKNDNDELEILTFLETAKKLVSKGNYDFVPRRKNLQDLAKRF